MDPAPMFKWGEFVRLTRDVRFYRGVDDLKGIAKGTTVKIQRVEDVRNDHGHFSYHLYHLRTTDSWDYWHASVMGDTIEPTNVLDRLADL